MKTESKSGFMIRTGSVSKGFQQRTEGETEGKKTKLGQPTRLTSVGAFGALEGVQTEIRLGFVDQLPGLFVDEN